MPPWWSAGTRTPAKGSQVFDIEPDRTPLGGRKTIAQCVDKSNRPVLLC